MGAVIAGLQWIATAIAAFFGAKASSFLFKNAIFLAVLAVIVAAYTAIDSTLRGLAGTLTLSVPDFGYFYYLFLPDNLTSVITIYVTTEIALAAYHWAFYLINRRVSIPV